MSLDVSLMKTMPAEVFTANVTHNLAEMADKAGIYKHLWRPEELGITHARELIDPLCEGLKKMKADPDGFRELNPPNGWGSYDRFVPWIEEYISACEKNPDAEISISR